VAGPSGNANKPSGSKKCDERFDLLSEYWLLKKDSYFM
jgi:hypothetical protein